MTDPIDISMMPPFKAAHIAACDVLQGFREPSEVVTKKEIDKLWRRATQVPNGTWFIVEEEGRTALAWAVYDALNAITVVRTWLEQQ